MSYPADTYTAGAPETSARFRSVQTPPDIARDNGAATHYLATGASTDGRFGLYRWEMGPAPAGPDPHFHRSISESFFVLDGTIRFYDGKRWVDGVPGDYLFVPEGGIHAFRNESGAPASMLILFAPGAPREDYFERIADAGQMPPDERAAFFVMHDTFWL